MSDHWRPDEDLMLARAGAAERVRSPEELVADRSARANRNRLPEGAKPGLLLVAALSFCVGMAVYSVMGPRDVVAPGAERHLADRIPR